MGPLAALEPWRCDGPAQGPTLPYLAQAGATTFDVRLEALVNGLFARQTERAVDSAARRQG